MGLFSRKHYVYVILSLGAPYIGKGSGDRIWESKKERHGITAFKVGRYFRSSAAHQAEQRLIRRYRRLGIPLQNGRSPNSSVWSRLSSRRSRRQRASLKDRLVGFAILGGALFWLLT